MVLTLFDSASIICITLKKVLLTLSKHYPPDFSFYLEEQQSFVRSYQYRETYMVKTCKKMLKPNKVNAYQVMGDDAPVLWNGRQ